MSKDTWDQRYADSEYVYGTSPNDFFKQELDKLGPGKILLPAEGEGRNAVYAAEKEWDVWVFDQSEEGPFHQGKASVIQLFAMERVY